MSMRAKEVKFYIHRADIENMKKLALIIVCGVASMALSAEEYTIQTISALKESSITPAFEQKIKKSGVPYIKKTEGDRHVVLLGSYKKVAATKHDVKKVRKVVTRDAFVRPMDRGQAAVATTPEKPTIHPEAVVHAAETAAASSHAADTNQTHAATPVVAPIAAAPTSAPAAAVEKKEETASNRCPAPKTTVVIYDRNLMRKSDISEAIEYYKNSPYHIFRPVALHF